MFCEYSKYSGFDKYFLIIWGTKSPSLESALSNPLLCGIEERKK